MTMPAEPTILRYMTRFRCIADRCEDTCCGGLRVPVSEARLQRMRATVASSPEDSERLYQLVLPSPGGASTEHAFIEMRPDGYCPFLDTERLCSLQRRHGDAVLPDICATFPRVFTKRGERVEVSGTLACPEVARLCLLEEDAVEPDSTPPASQDVADSVRAAMLRLLQRREYPLASRLAMLGQLAYALDGGSVEEVLQRFESSDVLEAEHRGFTSLALPGGPCVGLFTSVLKARLAAGRGERFTTLVRGVLESLSLGAGGPGELDLAWRTYVERWQRLEALHGERVHRYFHNYIAHSLWRSPFTEAPSPLAYVFRLALRVALLRLTFVCHPQVPTAASQEQLDRAAVETFQLVAKHVEQAPDFLRLAEGLMGPGRGADALGKVLVFAAF
ncbi:MAG TPA: flagellin lysine-N-methylase [Archangium sp.]|jgi:lysine-N-methylase|uniref:flagellin lysine-N-methylase n=1 Tax=Archangium sp. TaxID=1872627 RepID=UPI002ED8B940